MRRFAERMHTVQHSATIGLSDQLKEMQNDGKDVISLAAARPDFDTPQVVKEAAVEALRSGGQYTTYTESRGLLQLRQAVADKLQKENNLKIDPRKEVLITVGAREAIFCALQVLVDPGDEVLVFDPSWLSYRSAIQLAGGVPIPIPLMEEADFHPDPQQLMQLASDDVRVLVLNSPNNPTGAVFTSDEMREIARIAVERDWVIITDEIYEDFLYGEHEHISPAALSGMKNRTITCNSCSKGWAMTGWRVGYAAGPADLIDRMLAVHQHLVSSPCAFAQKGAVAAFTDARESVFDMVDSYRRRRQLLLDGLGGYPGVQFVPPEGACFLFLRFPGVQMNSEQLSQHFLRQSGLAMTPGAAFGEYGEGYLRLSFAGVDQQTIPEVLARLKRGTDQLQQDPGDLKERMLDHG